MAGVYAFFKSYKCNTPLAALLFLGYGPYLFGFNGMRQCVALGIGLFAFNQMNKSKVKTAILLIIAVLMHKSAIIILLMMILKTMLRKANKKLFYSVVFGSIVLGIAGEPIIYAITKLVPVYAARYGINGSYSTMRTSWGMSSFIWMGIAVIAVLLMFRIDWKSPHNEKIEECICFTLLAVAFLYLGVTIGGAQRISVYFQLYIVPTLFFFEKKIPKQYGKIFIMGVSAVAIVFFLAQAQTVQYSPYYFCWETR